jgi:hypothetical protein
MPDRHPHGVFDQGQHGDAYTGVAQNYFSWPFETLREICATRRDDRYRDQSTMKTPVVLVTATLTVAILLAASFLIATGTRGENAFRPFADSPSGKIMPISPTTK